MDSVCVVFEERSREGLWRDSCCGSALAGWILGGWDVTLVVISLQINLLKESGLPGL